LDVVKDEIDILYAASQKLAEATTPAEQLEAVSDYARSQGASAGALFYVQETSQKLETVAEWSTTVPLGVGTVVEVTTFAFARHWMRSDQPTLVPNVEQDPRVDSESLALSHQTEQRASAILPLYNKGRFVAVLRFSWREPHLFDLRDVRIFAAIQRQAAPVVDSVRLYEQTERRAQELEMAKRETDILYEALNQLTRANTPGAVLDAVSAYARDHGAISGLLLYVENDDQEVPQWQQITAAWNSGETSAAVGIRYPVAQNLRWFTNGDQPTLIEDIRSSPTLPESVRERLLSLGFRSSAILPLIVNGRYVGILGFNWKDPHQFTERDERIFTAIQRQAASVVDAARLYEQIKARTVRAEHLLRINTALSQASDELQILDALGQYVVLQKAFGISLNYIDMDEHGALTEQRIIAIWRPEGSTWYEPSRHRLKRLMDFGYTGLWLSDPERVVFVENLLEDERIDPDTRAEMRTALQTRAFAIIPLYNRGRHFGLVTIYWLTPHVFSAEEQFIYTTLIQTLPAVVATRRAYLAEEEARREAMFLYHASQIINAATSYDQIVRAVAQINHDSLNAALWVWDNFDYDSAEAGEIVAISDNSPWFVNLRVPISILPPILCHAREGVVIIEDAENSSTIDEVSAALLSTYNSRTFVGIPLSIGNRYAAVLTLHSEAPHHYRQRDKRVFEGIGELVVAALERVRLQAQQETAMLENEKRARELAALEERTRLARELHDSVSQALYGIGLGARTAHALLQRDPSRLKEPMDYILSLAEAGLTEMRSLIFELRPESLEQEGLITALLKQANSLQARHNIRVKTVFCEEPPLALEVKESLYRIAREALHNTFKHAHATEVHLSLTPANDGYLLEIADNGQGFQVHEDYPGHLGLKSMRERTTALNATLNIESAPGEGARISVLIRP
jgi:signal transduction histidine kinase